jgi:hypothetical protein
MRKISTHIAAALLLCSLAATAASAKVTSQVVSFGQDFYVGDTAVKAGKYKLSFDDKTNELTLTDAKTKTVVAKASATTAKRQSSSSGIELRMVARGDAQALAGVAFPGKDQFIALGGSTAADAAHK